MGTETSPDPRMKEAWKRFWAGVKEFQKIAREAGAEVTVSVKVTEKKKVTDAERIT